jgi:hypothetical protein
MSNRVQATILLSLLCLLWVGICKSALAQDELSNETKLRLLNCLIDKQQRVIDQISAEITTGTYGALDLNDFLATADTIGKGQRTAAYNALPHYLQNFIDAIENDTVNNAKDCAAVARLSYMANVASLRAQVIYPVERGRSQRLVDSLKAERTKLGQIKVVPAAKFGVSPVSAEMSAGKQVSFTCQDNIYSPKQVQYKWFVNNQLACSERRFELDGNKYAVTQPSKLSLTVWVFDPTQVDSCKCTLSKPKWVSIGTHDCALHWKQPMQKAPAQKPSPTGYSYLEIHYPPEP